MDMQAEWLAALVDASPQRAEAAVFLLPGAVAKDGQTRASYFHPRIDVLPHTLFEGEALVAVDEANSDAWDKHRVFVWTGDVDPLLVVAAMRHELEHARQWESRGRSISDLQDLLYHALAPKVSGLRNTGDLYNLMPAEMGRECRCCGLRSASPS